MPAEPVKPDVATPDTQDSAVTSRVVKLIESVAPTPVLRGVHSVAEYYDTTKAKNAALKSGLELCETSVSKVATPLAAVINNYGDPVMTRLESNVEYGKQTLKRSHAVLEERVLKPVVTGKEVVVDLAKTAMTEPGVAANQIVDHTETMIDYLLPTTEDDVVPVAKAAADDQGVVHAAYRLTTLPPKVTGRLIKTAVTSVSSILQGSRAAKYNPKTYEEAVGMFDEQQKSFQDEVDGDVTSVHAQMKEQVDDAFTLLHQCAEQTKHDIAKCKHDHQTPDVVLGTFDNKVRNLSSAAINNIQTILRRRSENMRGRVKGVRQMFHTITVQGSRTLQGAEDCKLLALSEERMGKLASAMCTYFNGLEETSTKMMEEIVREVTKITTEVQSSAEM
eukprot:GFYU01000932.1.p1 GENE.GFYU01000932.1~~GFYU01000932.1.p1  ORF type:complete len:413 (+),score=110.19 GFYU01000932.1:68-1240(+)